MRIMALLLVLLLSRLPVLSQLVSINAKNTPLETVLQEVSKQTHYSFFYQDQELVNRNLAHSKPITLTLKGLELPQALEYIFNDQPYAFELENTDKKVFITDKAGTGSTPVPRTLSVKGRVTDEQGKPLVGATILSKQSGKSTSTNGNGEYDIALDSEKDSLMVSFVSHEPHTQKVKLKGNMDFQLFPNTTALGEVVVSAKVRTGYKDIDESQMTGSFVHVDSAQFNRRISSFFIDRIENMATGVLFSKNQGTGSVAGQEVVVRGISTISGMKRPLIVIDNFPYDGDINNINPNDIESITILKDAVATGIWGAFAGNGVIVINTKKGKKDQAPKVSFVSNLTISAKPDLYYLPLMNSEQYMEVTDTLYRRGFYNSRIATPYSLVPPDVMILDSIAKGLLAGPAGEAKLAALRSNDIRADLSDNFYRKNVNQQYAININGGGNKMRYFFSAGYDKNQQNLVRNYYERITLTANNTYLLLKDKLELSAGVGFAQSTTADNNSGVVHTYQPYTSLVNGDGTPAAVQIDYRQGYKNSAATAALLDWNYYPLEELKLSDNVTKLTDYRVNLGAVYTILPGLTLTGRYQYGKGISEQENYRSPEMYFTRHLINLYSRIDGAGNVIRPIPYGGIMDMNSYDYSSHNGRFQIDYNKKWKSTHNISATVGAERRSLITQRKADRQYGYDPNIQRGLPVDLTTQFPWFPTPFQPFKIPDATFSLGTADHYLSYYTNLIYSYKYRYNFSVNLRRDQSNLFGSNINENGTPLWSIGAGWLISREKFFHKRWISELRLRATHGYTGNIDKNISPYTVVKYADALNNYNALQAYVDNPANRNLQWERVRITNLAIDFSTRKDRISGTLEFYIKNSTDLIGTSPVDQTTGVSSFRGNIADMRGKGFDFTLNLRFIDHKKWKWNGTFLYSYVTNRITGLTDTGKSINLFVAQIESNPLNGTPLESIYAYEWAGLNPANGNPRGFLNKEFTENYSAIFNSTDRSNMVYVGPSTPKFFGSYRNTITYKNIDLSFLIQYKLGYYFRNPSINYYSLYIGTDPGHADYSRRWMKPGDEATTNVPSMPYPFNQDRDILYLYSTALVEKADHVRLQDIQLSYSISKKDVKQLPFQSITLNIYINNIGVLWKAADSSLDPEFLKSTFRSPLTAALGLQVSF